MFTPDLLQKESDFKNPLPRQHREPALTMGYRIEMNRAAHVFAEANQSDPFARDRITLHMRRGIVHPSEVLKTRRDR